MTEEARCFDCNKTFNPFVAFERTHDGHRGCPHCEASLTRLFNQRSGEEEPDPEAVEINRNHDGSVDVKESEFANSGVIESGASQASSADTGGDGR